MPDGNTFGNIRDANEISGRIGNRRTGAGGRRGSQLLYVSRPVTSSLQWNRSLSPGDRVFGHHEHPLDGAVARRSQHVRRPGPHPPANIFTSVQAEFSGLTWDRDRPSGRAGARRTARPCIQ